MSTPPLPPTNPQDPASMHPSDKRNLIIFILASLLIWFAFDRFVLSPRTAALQEARVQAAQSAPAAAVPDSSNMDVMLPRADRIKEAGRVLVDAPELKGSISLKGGRVDDIVLRNFFVDLGNTDSVTMLNPAGSEHALYSDSGWLSSDKSVELPDANTVWSVKGNGNTALTPSNPVVLSWTNKQGVVFEKGFTIDDHFLIGMSLSVTNNSDKSISLYPYATLTRRGIPKDFQNGVAYEGPLGYIGDEMSKFPYDDLTEEPAKTFTALNGWIGFGEKYWLTSLIPTQMEEHSFKFQAVKNADKPDLTIYQLDVRSKEQTIAPKETKTSQNNLFVGAKKLSLLNTYGEKLNLRHFDLAVDFGALYFLTKPLYIALIFFNSVVGNFGIAIILLTVSVRALVYPLANKSYRSFAALRKVSPRMAEIKARYGNDKPRMQQELIKLYETERVNPMAGCFPLLLQIPIFFAVYKVITIAVEMRHAPFFGWIHDLSAVDPLSVFNLFGLLPFDVPTILHIGPWSLIMLVMLLIQKQLNPPPQDQIQRDIANYMPWIMTYMLSHFASGLVIYWAFSNTFSVIQQSLIMRSMGVPIYLFSPDAARAHHDSHKEETAKVLETIKKEQEDQSGKGGAA